jgi:hypothetical protein
VRFARWCDAHRGHFFRSAAASLHWQEPFDREVAFAHVVVEAQHGRAIGMSLSFCAIAASVAPDEMPTKIPSSRGAARRGSEERIVAQPTSVQRHQLQATLGQALDGTLQLRLQA